MRNGLLTRRLGRTAIRKYVVALLRRRSLEDYSSSILNSFPRNYFDWVYIDGDHSLQGVTRDLEATYNTLKWDGLILLNDYLYFSIVEFIKYGVIEATNDFCIKTTSNCYTSRFKAECITM